MTTANDTTANATAKSNMYNLGMTLSESYPSLSAVRKAGDFPQTATPEQIRQLKDGFEAGLLIRCPVTNIDGNAVAVESIRPRYKNVDLDGELSLKVLSGYAITTRISEDFVKRAERQKAEYLQRHGILSESISDRLKELISAVDSLSKAETEAIKRKQGEIEQLKAQLALNNRQRKAKAE
jgi:hypothetical protein